MLSVDDPRVGALRDQRASVVVTGLCGCGCASIRLAVDRGRHEPALLCRQPVSADIVAVDSASAEARNICGLLLFLEEGWLSLLEICWLDTPPPEFPPATAFGSPQITCEAFEVAVAALPGHADTGPQGMLDDAIETLRRHLPRRTKR